MPTPAAKKLTMVSRSWTIGFFCKQSCSCWLDAFGVLQLVLEEVMVQPWLEQTQLELAVGSQVVTPALGVSALTVLVKLVEKTKATRATKHKVRAVTAGFSKYFIGFDVD
jgi:hypothetical protein